MGFVRALSLAFRPRLPPSPEPLSPDDPDEPPPAALPFPSGDSGVPWPLPSGGASAPEDLASATFFSSALAFSRFAFFSSSERGSVGPSKKPPFCFSSGTFVEKCDSDDGQLPLENPCNRGATCWFWRTDARMEQMLSLLEAVGKTAEYLGAGSRATRCRGSIVGSKQEAGREGVKNGGRRF